MARLAGNRIPPALAIAPATLVSILVAAAGMMFVRLLVTGTAAELFAFAPGGWAAFGPEPLWPLWGPALAAAALAYHYRRRGRCGRCWRG